MTAPEHLRGSTTHIRHGGPEHRFTYGVDYVLIDPESEAPGPRLFSREGFNLWSVHRADHGGGTERGRGHGPEWVRARLAEAGAPEGLALRLLTQPRWLGYGFNPVSFWLALEGEHLRAVIAEVETPFGDRHSYLCHRPDFAPITPGDRITTPKALHVSPFQEVKGGYAFEFAFRPDRLTIRIIHTNGNRGLTATLSGPRAPLTSRAIAAATLRRPFGAARTMALIHWQALKLRLKGASYRRRPTPPEKEITPCSS
ncbi:DUF1365 domain-containing protein [Vannielia sp. SX4]|uniref:DUF1365 domain-containing protein n=1 Tax=Vannielia sp. SX4 TaxID=3463852 RepID=UPI0040592C21